MKCPHCQSNKVYIKAEQFVATYWIECRDCHFDGFINMSTYHDDYNPSALDLMIDADPRNSTRYATRKGDSRYSQDEWDALTAYADARAPQNIPGDERRCPTCGQPLPSRPMSDTGRQLFNMLAEQGRMMADIYRNLGR